MAHDLFQNSMAYVGDTPWHGLGRRVPPSTTAGEFLKAANLDWQVSLDPAPGAKHDKKNRWSRLIVMREAVPPETAPVALGMVTSQYEALQNTEAFAFFDPLIASNWADYEAAGALGDGETVWVQVRLRQDMEVQPGEALERYLLLRNQHNGKGAVSIRFTPVRVVCRNTLSFAVGSFSWSQAVRDWEAAQGDDRAIKTFRNTVLVETWQESGEAPDWQRLHDRREEWAPGTVAAEGLLLTAGVDVQRDRLEASIWGWAQDRQSWLIEHRILVGNPFEAAVWDELRGLLGETWRHASGHRLGLAMTAIDSGDGMTTAEVYAFVRRAGAGRAVAVKGQDGLRAAIGQPSATQVRRNGRKLGGLKVWPVGSSFLKGETYGWLKLERPTAESGDSFPPGFVHQPLHAAGEEFCRQLAAEQFVARAGRNGFRRLEWVKTRERNEALDCRVYARAADLAVW